MDIQTYERLFRTALQKKPDVKLARVLCAGEKNQYVKGFAFSQVHEAKRHILACEERTIRELGINTQALEW